jgi:oxygen-independent coproporphyrinogen-3 oxidase
MHNTPLSNYIGVVVHQAFLMHAQIKKLTSLLKEKFNFSDKLEMSIDIDPRDIEVDLAKHLYSLGFNRLSLAVQDLYLKV